jgi:hypothetical protein
VRVKIIGKYYDMRFAKGLKLKGFCEGPQVKGRKILISDALKGEKKLDIILHELLHAGDWDKDEEWIAQAATDFARILTKLGYHDGEETG